MSRTACEGTKLAIELGREAGASTFATSATLLRFRDWCREDVGELEKKSWMSAFQGRLVKIAFSALQRTDRTSS